MLSINLFMFINLQCNKNYILLNKYCAIAFYLFLLAIIHAVQGIEPLEPATRLGLVMTFLLMEDYPLLYRSRNKAYIFGSKTKSFIITIYILPSIILTRNRHICVKKIHNFDLVTKFSNAF